MQRGRLFLWYCNSHASVEEAEKEWVNINQMFSRALSTSFSLSFLSIFLGTYGATRHISAKRRSEENMFLFIRWVSGIGYSPTHHRAFTGFRIHNLLLEGVLFSERYAEFRQSDVGDSLGEILRPSLSRIPFSLISPPFLVFAFPFSSP
jgi:hypothetical protein